MGVLEIRDPRPFSRVRIGTVEHTHAVLPGIVGHDEPLAIRAKTALVARGQHRVQLDLPDAVADLRHGNIIFRCSRRRGNAGDRLHACAVDHDADGEHPQRNKREGMDRMVHAIVRAREPADCVARQLARVDEIFAHRNHLPVELVALGAAVIVEARFRRHHELGDPDFAALEPIVLESAVRFVPVPIEAEGRYDLCLLGPGSSCEKRHDIFLSIRGAKSPKHRGK